MKSDNEIANTIFERRDEHLARQKAKRKKLIQISSAVGCFVLAVGIGLGMNMDKWVRTQVISPTQIGGAVFPTAPLTTSQGNSAENLTSTSPLTTIPTTDRDESWTTSPTTDPSVIMTTVPPELYHEIDWSYRSTPGKFFFVFLDSGKYGDVTIKSNIYSDYNEYVYPFHAQEEHPTTRKATEFIPDMPIEVLDNNGNVYRTTIDIFTLEGLNQNLAIGVRFPDDDRIYTYINTWYIPETLGEFLEAIDYDNTVTYGGITLYPGNNFPVNNKNLKDIKKYLLSDYNVANIKDMSVTETCATATIHCRELGKENKFLKISESGYISTNLIGYEYVFYIGKEAVADFLKNSYNITFEQINEIYYATMKTTEPYTANTTTTPAKAPDGVSYGATTVNTTTDPSDPVWWCGTEME